MPNQSGKPAIYLVDAYAQLFQVFHAIRDMTSPKGFPTNALFGLTRYLLFLYQEKKPDYLISVFDGEQKTFRDEIFAEYKANRSEMPEQLRMQLEPVSQLLEALRIPRVVVEGYEADDVMATLAKKGEELGAEVFICSSDKDCRQLITEKTKIYNLRKNRILGREELMEEWGVTPEQVIDLQAMVGDSVDNIQGVPGIGVKTAAKLLQEYQTLDNLLEHADDLKGKRRENLIASVDTVRRNQELVRLKTDVPIEADWEAWARKPLNGPKLLELFREWGFHRFADQVQAEVGGGDHSSLRKESPKPSRRPPAGNGEPSLFPDSASAEVSETTIDQKRHGAPPAGQAKQWRHDYRLIDTPKAFADFAGTLEKQTRFAVDLETTGLKPLVAEIVGFAICFREGEAYYLPLMGPEHCNKLEKDRTLERLKPILENPDIEKVNQNIKYDALVLRQQGITLHGIAGDSMIADYLLNAGERRHDLDNLARNYLSHEMIPISDLIGKRGTKQKGMDEVDPAKVTQYAAEDADVAWRLCETLETKLESVELKQLYDELEIPLIDVLIELEYNGIRLDIESLEELGEKLGQAILGIENAIYESAGKQFHIASLKQLREVLFGDLGLKAKRKTSTGEWSTDQETLEQLAAEGHELPQQLLELRRLTKLKGTYIDALPKLVHPRTGRLHASFNQTVAATGRLSSSEPNLQNIPIRSDIGGQIRQAFIPEEGWALITADYSQIELRLLAHFCRDPELLRAFAEDRDVHALVAAQIYGVTEKEVTPEMRRMAKTVNFGVIYGMSAHGLAQRLQIPRSEAETFISAYFQQFPNVLEYQDNLLRRCRETGYVSTILGRRRMFSPEVIRENSTYRQRNQAEREAINMEIQGSAADLIKVAMLNIHRRLARGHWQTKMLLQIHDELVFESPESEVNKAAAMIVEEMNGALKDRIEVPLKVDVAAGANWLDAQRIIL